MNIHFGKMVFIVKNLLYSMETVTHPMIPFLTEWMIKTREKEILSELISRGMLYNLISLGVHILAYLYYSNLGVNFNASIWFLSPYVFL